MAVITVTGMAERLAGARAIALSIKGKHWDDVVSDDEEEVAVKATEDAAAKSRKEAPAKALEEAAAAAEAREEAKAKESVVAMQCHHDVTYSPMVSAPATAPATAPYDPTQKRADSMSRAESGTDLGHVDITKNESENGLPLWVSWSFPKSDLESTNKQIAKTIRLRNFGSHALVELKVLIKARVVCLKKGGDNLKKNMKSKGDASRSKGDASQSKGGASIQIRLVSDAVPAANTTMTCRLAVVVDDSKPSEVRSPFETKIDGVLAPKPKDCPEGEWWHLKGDRQKITLCMEFQNKADNQEYQVYHNAVCAATSDHGPSQVRAQ